MECAVSVIVPIYKAESYLRKCIDGILLQTFTDFQLILVDDGSPDKSGEICDEYAQKDSRVVVIHKTNGGLTSARKYGMNHAKGEYSIHIDPDDWVELSLLEELYHEAVKTDADMVICDFWEHCNNEVVYSRQKPKTLDNKEVMTEMFTTLKGTMWNKLIRTSCYKQCNIQFYEDLVLIEDLFLMFQFLLHPLKISYVPKALYHYERNTNPNSLTMANGERFKGYADGICRHFKALLKPYPYFWNLWVEKEMPWIAYLSLYYDIFDSKRFYEEFYYLLGRRPLSFSDKMVRIALRSYPLGKLIMKTRFFISMFCHKILS
ncbi:MAG: glycosyltransferase family 2 protein [Prevotella sp.]|nr:glycosyltransferase family 2 protein [Prevotella sp.]